MPELLVVEPVFAGATIRPTDATIFHVNPSGTFVIGGPNGDAGLTGRKGAIAAGADADLCVVPSPEPLRAAEVVRVRVRDPDRVHALDAFPQQLQPQLGRGVDQQPAAVHVDRHAGIEAHLYARLDDQLGALEAGEISPFVVADALRARSSALMTGATLGSHTGSTV